MRPEKKNEKISAQFNSTSYQEYRLFLWTHTMISDGEIYHKHRSRKILNYFF